MAKNTQKYKQMLRSYATLLRSFNQKENKCDLDVSRCQ